ncbi:Putative FKBP-type peptidyl-prolyl cis-trans isomerase [uncultured archaeon]|nr:Putative FKBP-type peptidyl-prolyl cis-trans isomerase [uncultured archaeon]
MKIGTILTITTVLFFSLCMSTQDGQTNQNPTAAPPQPVKIGERVRIGDIVSISSTVRLQNGTILDTTERAIAEANGIFNENERYAPIVVRVGRGEIIPGIEQALVEMQVGETRNLTVPPELGYGFPDPRLYNWVPIIAALDSTMEINRTLIEQENLTDIKVGETLLHPTFGLRASVINVTNETVTIQYVPGVTSYVNTEFGSTTFTVINGTTVLMILPNLTAGDRIETQTGYARIAESNKTHYLIDENNPYAGRTLVYEIKINDIEG